MFSNVRLSTMILFTGKKQNLEKNENRIKEFLKDSEFKQVSQNESALSA